MRQNVKEKIYEMLEKIEDEQTLLQVKDDVEFYTSSTQSFQLTTQQVQDLEKAIAEADNDEIISMQDFKTEISEWKKKS
jgi:flagellar biosynthesis chaperone FliJ